MSISSATGRFAWDVLKRLLVVVAVGALIPVSLAAYPTWHDAKTAAVLEASAPLLAGLVSNPGDHARTVDGLCRPGRDGSRYITASRLLDDRIHAAAPLGSPVTDLVALLSKQGFVASTFSGDGISRMYRLRRYGALPFDEQSWTINWTADEHGRIASLQGCAAYSYMGP